MEGSARRVASALLAGAVLLGLAWLSPRAIPFNMDEFVHYHALGCATAPLGRDLPSFRDGCGLYDLRLPGSTTALPLRSYSYIGSFPVLPFYPFWRLLGAPIAARLQGAVFLGLLLLLASRILNVRLAAAVAAALVYPIFPVSVIVDEGPLGLSALLFVAALGCVQRSLESRRRAESVAWGTASGFLLFLGIWVKLVFAWWLPAAGAFALFQARRRGEPLFGPSGRRWPGAVAGALALALPTLVLLASVDGEGRAYGATLRRGRISAELEQAEAGGVRLARYVVDASLLAPRNVLLPHRALDVLPALLAAGLLLLGLGRAGGRRAEVAGWVSVAVMTFGFVSLSAYSQWPHHLFFALLPLIFALALVLDGAGPRLRGTVLLVAILFWGTLAARWPAATFPTDASPAKDALLRFVRDSGLDRETLQAHTSWGTYYVAQLFGDPARLVVYVKGLTDDPRQLRQVAQLARRHRRPLLLSSSRRWERLQTPAAQQILGEPVHTWRFGEWWLVEYGPRRPE